MQTSVGIRVGSDDAMTVTMRRVIHEVVRVGSGNWGHVTSSIDKFQVGESEQLLRMKGARIRQVVHQCLHGGGRRRFRGS